MTKQEKVIKGLECSLTFINEFGDCSATSKECPYAGEGTDCCKRLMIDALALFKAQKSAETDMDNTSGFAD